MSSKVNQETVTTGYFSGTVFNNGRIMMVIKEESSRIYTSDGSRVLVDKYYPELDVYENNTWRKVNFTTHMYIHDNYEGWHFVTIFMKNNSGDNMLSLTLTYAEKPQFRLYAPLFPHLEFRTSQTSVKYRVIWHLEGLGIRNFALIKNETHKIIYNGTVYGGMRFERGQDIIIGYDHGKKMFGLNWENWKDKLPVLEVKNGKDLSISIESDPEVSNVGTSAVPPGPIPDSGSGGTDKDLDGLSDYKEESGWDAWWYDCAGVYHRIHVTSDPNNPDTDGDNVGDYDEWANSLNPRNVDTDRDSMSDYYELNYGAPNGGWQEVHWYNGRYAVLISSTIQYMDEFWNDLKIMHDILVNNYGFIDDNEPGFNPTADHIAYLFGDGNDVRSGIYGSPEGTTITDFSATKDNIKTVFTNLNYVMTDHDLLFVFTFDHGAHDANYQHSFLEVQDGEIRDDDFSQNYVGLVQHYARRIIVMQQCFSGGFINDFYTSTNTIMITACTSTEEAHEADDYPTWENEYVNGRTYHHAEFSYHFMSALRGETPQGNGVNADYNNNGAVSIYEAFDYANSHDSYNPNSDMWNSQHSQADVEYPRLVDLGGGVDRCYI